MRGFIAALAGCRLLCIFFIKKVAANPRPPPLVGYSLSINIFPNQFGGGVCWKKSELILNKIPTDCRASLGRTKTERSGGQKGRPARNASHSEAGGGSGGKEFLPALAFRRFFFRRRNFSYFALRNAPPERKLCLPRTRAHTTDLLPKNLF